MIFLIEKEIFAKTFIRAFDNYIKQKKPENEKAYILHLLHHTSYSDILENYKKVYKANKLKKEKAMKSKRKAEQENIEEKREKEKAIIQQKVNELIYKKFIIYNNGTPDLENITNDVSNWSLDKCGGWKAKPEIQINLFEYEVKKVYLESYNKDTQPTPAMACTDLTLSKVEEIVKKILKL
jgi:hypothetical protein